MVISVLIKKSFTTSRAAETWDPVVAVPFPFKFVVISQFLIWIIVSQTNSTMFQDPVSTGHLPRSMSLKAYITIRLLPSTLMILAVQLGVQLWLMNLAMPPRFVASMTVFSSIRKR